MTVFYRGLLLTALVFAAGCPTEVEIEPPPPVAVERLAQGVPASKIDLLLAIDNSISMADKQAFLAAAVPDLVNRLVQPLCVDESGIPTGDLIDEKGKCAVGVPEFPAVRDINVGVISSSLGDLTSDACGSASILNADDRGRLLTRTGSGSVVTDFEGKGFLAWDPDSARGGQTNASSLISDLADMVVGVDQRGCGIEMQLESVVRFLVDPNPYDSLQAEANTLSKVGTDAMVLQQRKDFLRADSVVAIVVLSDENDCSFDVTTQGFLALGGPFYRATSECADDPLDACCSSCGLSHEGCDAGGACVGAEGPIYAANEDHVNLKCWQQKRRYGVDFLYPLARYVNAFTQPLIDPSVSDLAGDKVANPLFSDLSGSGAPVRGPERVFVTALVGVPWQAIARRNDNGVPDLRLGFKSFEELAPDLDYLIGDPERGVEPGEPFMQESIEPRVGTSELLGASPASDNPINGNDWTIGDEFGPNDLEYACIFRLPQPNPEGPACDTCDEGCDNPLCSGTTQISAKAYPGLRELGVLRGLGPQAVFASICPAEVIDENSPIYGYRPAMATMVGRLKEQLAGQCLPSALPVDATGMAGCFIVEARDGGDACGCDPNQGRAEIPAEIDGKPNPKFGGVESVKADESVDPSWNCFCEIVQLEGETKQACQNDPNPDAPSQGDGWCYLDATANPPIGDPSLLSQCPAESKRIVRFVGQGDPSTGATVFVACPGE